MKHTILRCAAGLLIAAALLPTALAAAISGTATRTMSQPAAARARICARVASTSSVRVLVMDWMAFSASCLMVLAASFVN